LCRDYLEAIVSAGVVVAVQVPVPGGVINLTQVEVHALLAVLGGHSSDSANGSKGRKKTRLRTLAILSQHPNIRTFSLSLIAMHSVSHPH
jgi:hypothetical protein